MERKGFSFMSRSNHSGVLRFSLILVTTFGIIYGSRTFFNSKAQSCPSLCKYEDSTSELNEGHFNKFVRPSIKGNSRLNLIIFLDPARECPVCLYETEYWLAPLGATPDFRVHFFIPQETNQEKLRGYLNAFNLAQDQVTYFDGSSHLKDYTANGLVKIFLDREKGIRWYEFGNSAEADQQKFLEKLNDTLANP